MLERRERIGGVLFQFGVGPVLGLAAEYDDDGLVVLDLLASIRFVEVAAGHLRELVVFDLILGVHLVRQGDVLLAGDLLELGVGLGVVGLEALRHILHFLRSGGLHGQVGHVDFREVRFRGPGGEIVVDGQPVGRLVVLVLLGEDAGSEDQQSGHSQPGHDIAMFVHRVSLSAF